MKGISIGAKHVTQSLPLRKYRTGQDRAALYVCERTLIYITHSEYRGGVVLYIPMCAREHEDTYAPTIQIQDHKTRIYYRVPCLVTYLPYLPTIFILFLLLFTDTITCSMNL